MDERQQFTPATEEIQGQIEQVERRQFGCNWTERHMTLALIVCPSRSRTTTRGSHAHELGST